MSKKIIPTKQKLYALLATQNPTAALISAGWTASALISAGWTASDLISAGFTASELKEWDDIPIIKDLYSKLLEQIESGQRIHNQKTFGPDCDPKNNLCKTPMCTAGHLVNFCGEIGYKLKQKYGFEVAASMIHMKNRPDVPLQNFGDIPQEFAMAYIRERALEEKSAK